MYNEKYMDLALKLAKKAYKKNEIPVGCVIVYQNKIIGCGYNKKERTKSVLEHAELIAIKKASKKMKNWRLDNCEMYVTLEPCPMCASAIHQSRIKIVYYGCESKNPKNSLITEKIYSDINSNSATTTCGKNIQETKSLLENFFKKIR